MQNDVIEQKDSKGQMMTLTPGKHKPRYRDNRNNGPKNAP